MWLRFAPIGLAFLTPVTALYTYPSVRAAVLATLALPAARADRHQWRFFLSGVGGLFALMLVLSTLWSSEPLQTGFSIGNWVVELVAALALVSLPELHLAIRMLTQFMKAVLLVSAVFAVFAPSVGRMSIPGQPWQGVFLHKNSLGAIAAFAIPLFAVQPRGHQRALWIGCALGTLWLSDSKGALAAALLSLAIMSIAARVYVGSDRAATSRAGFYGILIALALIGWLAFDSLLTLLGRDSTLTGRTNLWSIALRYGASNWIFGDGIGAQIYEGSDLYRQIAAARGDPFATARALGTTHNGFIALYLGVGIVGCFLFVLLCVKVLRLIDAARLGGAQYTPNVLLAFGLTVCYLAINITGDQLLARGGWFFFAFGAAQLIRARQPGAPSLHMNPDVEKSP
jgi:O-antigen ligase